MAKNQERQKSIEKSVEAIFEKARAREKAGGDLLEVGWQSTLEIMLGDGEAHS